MYERVYTYTGTSYTYHKIMVHVIDRDRGDEGEYLVRLRTVVISAG